MRKIKFFMNVFAFVFYVDTFEVVRKHKSDPWPNRDTFQKGVYSYRNEKIDITECNSTYVDGGVEADHSSSSSRICNCGTGETFYIDSTKLPPRPKCIRLFGNEELSIKVSLSNHISLSCNTVLQENQQSTIHLLKSFYLVLPSLYCLTKPIGTTVCLW